MKNAFFKKFGAIWTALALACGAVAADVDVEVVVGETAAFQTSANVYRRNAATLTVSTGTSRNQVAIANAEAGTYGTTASITPSSTAKQTFYVKGLAYTSDKATVTSTYKSSSNSNTSDTYNIYVAEGKHLTMQVGDAAVSFTTPTVSSRTYWNIHVVEGSDVVDATMNTSIFTSTSKTVTVTPKKAGTAIVEVRSGAAGSGGVLRQKIYVTVTKEPQTKDVALVQNDTVQFFFQCATRGGWHVKMNETAVEDKTDTQGGYVSVTRSNAFTENVTDFNVTVWARRTTAAGQKDVLTITDPAGNAYQYTFTVGRCPAVDVSQGEKTLDPVRVCTALSGNAWTKTEADFDVASAEMTTTADAANVTITAKNTAGEAAFTATTITVSNHQASGTNCERGAIYTLRVSTLKPRPVTLCEGDAAEIYFHKTAATKWFLSVNGNLVMDGSAIDGNQMRLQLTSAGSDTDAILTAETIKVGDGLNKNGDLIVISTADGDDIYPYRANVLPAREVPVGMTVDVDCYSVTDKKPWSCDLMPGADGYVTVDCTAKTPDTASSKTTATITGVAMTEEDGAVVAVRNNNYFSGQADGQGGVYFLKTHVVGVPKIPVYLSAGVTMPVAFGNDKATEATTYAVSAGTATLSATDLVVADDNKSFTLNLKADASAVQGDTCELTVTTNDAEFVKYNVIVMQSITLEKGTVAPGFLYGARTPWTTSSSNPEVFGAQPVLYNHLYSAEGRALNPGDAVSLSTNTTLSAGYWGIAVRVYAVHESAYQVHTGTAENPAEPVTFTLEAPGVGHDVTWHVGSNGPDGKPARVTVDLDQAAGSSSVNVTITAKAGAKGPETFEISNGYYVERVSVYVTDDTSDKPTHRRDSAIQVLVGDYVDLPAIASSQDWTASIADSTIVSVAPATPVSAQAGEGDVTGAAGEAIRVTGLKVGTTYVSSELSDVIYIYTVQVLPKNGETLTPVTVYVGDQEVKVLQNERQGAKRVWTDDILVATAQLGSNSAGEKTCVITGVQEGKTQVHVQVGDTVYNAQVTTVRKRIDRYVDLVISKDGESTSTYSYTYDGLDAWTNKDPAHIAVTKGADNKTLTFKPLAVGHDVQVVVPAYVDSNGLKTDIYYHFTITKLADDTIKIKDFGDAYFGYAGEPTITETADKVTLVFTDPDQAGTVKIPEGYTALMDILTVGGGGGGGSPARFGQGGGGGGAGGFATLLDKRFTASSLYFTVGRGGPGGDGSELGHAYFGLTGEDSTVTDDFDHTYVVAFGGGGGGAPGKSVSSGLNGASGGGAAWYGNVAGKAGESVQGQGHDGAVPTVSGCGAGGGGAGEAGGATSPNGNGLGGAGRASDLSGTEVVYAKGGDGGRNDIDTLAAAGVNPGDGGNGGNGGPGGNGADGTVVVTIKKLYRNILVPVPTTNDLVTARFLWENGKTVVPFDPQGLSFRSATDSHPYLWSDVIDKIVGTTNVVCSLDATKSEEQQKVGVGYYNFTIYLKEGFAWDVPEDEAYAATSARRYSWTVVSDWNNTDAALEVSKNVIWDPADKMKATVRIEANSSPEKSGGGVPNVLFLGSLCNAHGFSYSVLKAGLDAITEVGNVDYKLYNKNTTTPSYSGTLTKGQKFNASVSMASNNHASMDGFYAGLDDAMSNGKKYDYIVFSFDRAKTASGFDGTYDGKHSEAEISAWLRPFYDDDAVIWMLDNQPKESAMPFNNGNPTDPNATGNGRFWSPSQVVVVSSGSSDTWTSLHYYAANYGSTTVRNNAEARSYQAYKGLMGLFDPGFYATNMVTQAVYKNNSLNHSPLKTADKTSYDLLKGEANENQVVYDNAKNVADMITSIVKVKPFDLQLEDKIMSPAKGLTIDTVTVQAYTPFVDGVQTPDSGAWYDIISWDATTGQTKDLDPTHKSGIQGASMTVDAKNNVTVTLKQIAFEVLTRFDTRVTDDGTFRMVSEEDETIYNQSSGLYEKNPNDGPANVSLRTENGEAIGVEGEAETEIPWSFTAYPVEAKVVNGTALVGGRNTKKLNVYEGGKVTTYFYGNPGYKLSALLLDQENMPLPENGEFTIENVNEAHTLQINFTDFRGTTEATETSVVYDAQAHVFPVVLNDDWDTEYPIEIRYSLNPEGPFLTEEEFVELYSTDPERTKVGDHTYYYHVFVEQPGYGEDGKPGFVDVGVDGEGKGTVTITKKPVTITANSFNIYGNQEGREEKPLPEDYKGVTVGGLIGDDVTTIGARINEMVAYGTIALSCPTYKFVEGQYPVVAETARGTDADIVGGNYEIHYLPGVVSVIKVPMKIGDVTQFEGLDPEDPLVDTGVEKVVKTYDGIATNLTVNVTLPTPDKATIKYSTDEKGTWSDTNPTFTHAGTYKVWYAVETGDDTTDDKGYPFFPVTNYQYVVVQPRPITVTSASATKTYDGTPLVKKTASITEGSLVAGDTIAFTVTGERTAVGVSPNDFTATVTSRDAGVDGNADYTITKVNGELTVTPAAMVIGGVEQPLDPNFPLPYGETGVVSVEKTYDGEPTNILVTVTRPENGYTIKYATNRSGPWSDEVPIFTYAGSYTVYYAVEDEVGNYAAVTNFARVVINPAEVTVTANDVGKRQDQKTDPDLTATVAGVSVTREVVTTVTDEEGHVEYVHTVTLANDDVITYSLTREPGTTVGEYPIYAGGDEYQSGKDGVENPNYHVTYVPGVFSIGEGQAVLSLWITDHEYASKDEVYLAFLPRGSVGAIDNDFVLENLVGKIKVRCATSQSALSSAEAVAATLRYPSKPVEPNGWIWIKVKLPQTINVREPLLWQIVVGE